METIALNKEQQRRAIVLAKAASGGISNLDNATAMGTPYSQITTVPAANEVAKTQQRNSATSRDGVSRRLAQPRRGYPDRLCAYPAPTHRLDHGTPSPGSDNTLEYCVYAQGNPAARRAERTVPGRLSAAPIAIDLGPYSVHWRLPVAAHRIVSLECFRLWREDLRAQPKRRELGNAGRTPRQNDQETASGRIQD